jgi:hypothetical protein
MHSCEFGLGVVLLKRRSIEIMMIASVVIIVVGTAFLLSRLLQPPPHLEPFDGDTEGLDSKIVFEGMVISISKTEIQVGRRSEQPSPVYCRVHIEITNTGDEDIDDFKAIRGTLFRENHTPIFSYWITMSLGFPEPVDLVSIHPLSTAVVYCSNDRPFYLEHAFDIPRWVYLRIQVMFCTNLTAILTTPLTQIL